MNRTGYIFYIISFVSIYFILNSFIYVKFQQEVLPAGDPFTYTVGFFKLINYASASIENYVKAVVAVCSPFGPNWYWVLNLFVAILSPILPNESFAISVINIGLFGTASVFAFYFARSQEISKPLSLISAMIIWIFPVNYGFSTYESLPVLGLDASFAAVYTIACFATLIFVNSPEKLHSAIFAGILVGFSVWGRGNSIPTIGLILFVPIVWMIFKKRIFYERKVLVNCFLFTLISIVFAAYFYYSNWQALANYYANHTSFFSRHAWNLSDASKWIANIPGFLFWRNESAPSTIIITVLCHVFMVASLIAAFMPRTHRVEKINIIRLLSISGAFIYFVQLLVNIIFFTDPLFSLLNVLLIYRPMTLGMTLSLMSVLFLLYEYKKIVISERAIVPSLLVLLIWGIAFTYIQTPWNRGHNLDSPKKVERFAEGIDDQIGEGAISILWYGHYNPSILRYYRTKNKLEPLMFARFGHADQMWSASDHSNQNRSKTIKEIRKHIQNASLLIVPEFLDMYQGPYAFYKFSEDWAKIFSEPESPTFRIIKYLKEPQGRLLVLKREDLSSNLGDPLSLPYGRRPSSQRN